MLEVLASRFRHVITKNLCSRLPPPGPHFVGETAAKQPFEYFDAVIGGRERSSRISQSFVLLERKPFSHGQTHLLKLGASCISPLDRAVIAVTRQLFLAGEFLDQKVDALGKLAVRQKVHHEFSKTNQCRSERGIDYPGEGAEAVIEIFEFNGR